MEQEEKKALILLKSLIFHYHGLDPDEKKILEGYVNTLDAEEEYHWANDFISSDYLSAFERCKEFISKVFKAFTKKKRLMYLVETWEDNHKKGYVTEMETTAMINLSKEFEVDAEFLKAINH